jgi:hypothetical protein
VVVASSAGRCWASGSEVALSSAPGGNILLTRNQACVKQSPALVYTLSLTTVLLITATYIPLRIMCLSQTLPLLVSLILFGTTQHDILNPTTFTGAILILLDYQPALQQYLDPISIAINVCTTDPILTIAITGFQNWMPASIPTLNTGHRTRRILLMIILLLLITPVEAIPSLQDAEILSKAATLLSTF